MEAVVVLVELHGILTYNKLTSVDTVGIAAYRATEVSFKVPGEVILNLVEATDNILEVAVLVRHYDADYTSAKVGDASMPALLVRV